MSTFAIYYNLEDLSTIGGNVSNPQLSGSDKTMALRFWNGGLKNWASAPLARSRCDDPGLPSDARRIIVTVQNLTMADLVALLRRFGDSQGGNVPGAGGYLYALASDIEQCGEDPYPPV